MKIERFNFEERKTLTFYWIISKVYLSSDHKNLYFKTDGFFMQLN